MSFDIPTWTFYIGSWFGLIGGVWALFDRAEKVASDDVKRSIASWLQNVSLPDTTPWTAGFLVLFEKLYGKKHLSWRCTLISWLTSLIFCLVLWLAWLANAPQALWYSKPGPGDFFELFLLALVFNLLTDYLSLFQTRIILKRLIRTAYWSRLALLLIVDFLLTGLIFLFALLTAGFFVASDEAGWIMFTTAWVETLRGFTMGPVNGDISNWSLGPYLYTTYATSIWLWLYAFSGAIAKGLNKANSPFRRFKSFFDFDNKPIHSLGFISMLLVSIVYLTIPLFRFIF